MFHVTVALAFVVTVTAHAQLPDLAAYRVVSPELLDSLEHSYRARDFATFTRRLAEVGNFTSLAQLVSRRGPWRNAEQPFAAFVVEAAKAAYVTQSAPNLIAGDRLIEIACETMRREPATAFGRWWAIASTALQQGASRLDKADDHLDHLLQWLPNEPSLLLARAIVADQRTSPMARGQLTDSLAHGAGQAYERAMKSAEVAAEATTRLAYLHYRRGRVDEAATLLAAAPRSSNLVVRYWTELIRGRVLDALDRKDEAIAAYSQALTLFPAAQSPQVALAALRFARGDVPESAALVEFAIGGTAGHDPWWDYWLGDYRLFDGVMNLLRSAGNAKGMKDMKGMKEQVR